MKTGEKLAAGWLLTLGFMFLSSSTSALLQKNSIPKINIFIQGERQTVLDISSHKLYRLNNTITGGLKFGVPSLLLGAWLALGIYKQKQQEKQAIQQQINNQLQSLFYRMLQENNGRVTLLGFAMQSQLPASVAKEYLDQQARVFSANFKVNEEGGISYHFDL